MHWWYRLKSHISLHLQWICSCHNEVVINNSSWSVLPFSYSITKHKCIAHLILSWERHPQLWNGESCFLFFLAVTEGPLSLLLISIWKKKMHTQTQQILDIQLHFHAADGEDSLFRPDGVIKTALCSTYFFMSGASNIINFSSISLLSHTENTNLKTAASRFIADRENKPLENNKPGQGLCGSRVKKPIFHSIIQYSCCHQ